MSKRNPTMNVLRAAMVAVAMLAAPSQGHAQSDDAARARAGLDAAAAARFDAALERARSQGLPTQSLVSKALEGIAKQVTPARIAGAVEQRLAVLGRAQAALGSPPGANGDISSVADAMQRGVSADAVHSLREQAGADEPIGIAAHVLADLSERGVPVDNALEVLAAWRQRGGRPDELPAVAAGVDRLLRQGMLPAQAAAAVAGAMRAGQGPPGGGPPANPGVGAPPDLPGPPAVPPGTQPGKGRGRGRGPPP